MNGSNGTESTPRGVDWKAMNSFLPLVAGVKDGYERWAPSYDSFPNPLLCREERHVIPLLPALRNRRVLDLACGTGRWLAHLARDKPSLEEVGVDLSSAMLRVAAGKRLAAHVVQADCLSLPFQSFAFDLAICSFALGHFRQLHRVGAEIARVMKPVVPTCLFPICIRRLSREDGGRVFRDQTRPASGQKRAAQGGGYVAGLPFGWIRLCHTCRSVPGRAGAVHLCGGGKRGFVSNCLPRACDFVLPFQTAKNGIAKRAMSTPALRTNRAYWDVTAENYDHIFPETVIGKMQRDAVWRDLDKAFQPGQRILELNCGTGIDAAHLAKRGVQIVACDLSAKMLDIAGRARAGSRSPKTC